VESAGYRVVDQSNSADLEIRLDADRADSLVIGDDGLAVAKDDTVALRAALRLASQRRAS
jgi:hypothetical protein